MKGLICDSCNRALPYYKTDLGFTHEGYTILKKTPNPYIQTRIDLCPECMETLDYDDIEKLLDATSERGKTWK